MSTDDVDPWGMELVPLRSAPERGESSTASVGNDSEVDLVKILGQIARGIDRIETRLGRLERAFGMSDAGLESPTLSRLRRESAPQPAPDAPPVEPVPQPGRPFGNPFS